MSKTILVFLSLAMAIRAEMEGFIVGGAMAAINKYPHSAFLTVTCIPQDNPSKKVSWICGSSLLNQRILLTAAHCLYPCGVGSKITINMGDEERTRGLVRNASGFAIHEKYNPAESHCDIGLIMMSRPVKFSSRIKRVAIMKEPPYNEPAYLAGWGMINEKTKEHGMKLKQVDQTVWKHTACLDMFGVVPRGTICASAKKKIDFAAQGDSGSALIVRGYIQIGLVSFKIPDVADNVIVYTDVGFHYDWISYNAQRIYCFKSLNVL